jgi:hypothetical protein
MRRLLLACLLLPACAADEGPTSSKVTLDGDSWTATAVSSDRLSPAAVTIFLAHEVDLAQCGWTVFDQVELSLLIGDRAMPHVLDELDVTTPNSGRVVYTDPDQRNMAAVSGRVTPTLTRWTFSEEEGHNVVVGVDGEIDVTLADGRELTAVFSATPCADQ